MLHSDRVSNEFIYMFVLSTTAFLLIHFVQALLGSSKSWRLGLLRRRVRTMYIHILPCRFVQRQRYRNIRKRTNRQLKCNLRVCQATLFGIMLCSLVSFSTQQFGTMLASHVSYRDSIFQTPYRWVSKMDSARAHISRRSRNRLMHYLNGNGGGKSKGKGRGKTAGPTAAPHEQQTHVVPSTTAADPDADLRQQVQMVVPDAARLRAQTTLLDAEWSVPVVPWQALAKDNAIAVVPKSFLPEVIKKVGFSGKSIAAVLTQDPDSLGLIGYDRKFLRVGLSTMGPGGERVITSAKRYVVQLGWGPAVEQIMEGEEVPMLFTMCRFQCKFPTVLGWPEGPLPAALIMTEIERHIPADAVAEIQPRHNDTATCLVHSEFANILLRASGKNSVFYKESSPVQEYMLLWLEEGTTLQDAVKLADHDDVFGVVRKGNAAAPKYALRFRDTERLKQFAADHSILDLSNLGRWKIYGIDNTVGTFGLLAWLTQRGFQDVEVLYVSDSTGVWLASAAGNLSPGYYVQNGVKMQFHIKALNNVARDQAKAKNSSAASSASKAAPKISTRAAKQQAFVKSLSTTVQPGSPKKEPVKRKEAQPKTGMTPESKKTEASHL